MNYICQMHLSIIIVIKMCCFLAIQTNGSHLQYTDKILSSIERHAIHSPYKADSLLGCVIFPDIDSLPHSPHTYGCFSNIYLAKAILSIKRNNIDYGKQMLHNVIKMDILDGNNNHTKEDFLFLESIILFEDSITIDEKELLIKKLHESLKARLCCHLLPQQTLIERSIISNDNYLITLSIIIIVTVFLYIYIRKSDKNNENILEYHSTLQMLNNKAEHYKTIIVNYKEQSAYYEKQLNLLRKNTNERLGKGKKIMDHILNGGLIKNISIQDEQCFIDYYAFSNPERYNIITRDYSSLSLRHTTYLVLVELGYSDTDIQKILFVKDSTIRNYRSRMNKKGENSHKTSHFNPDKNKQIEHNLLTTSAFRFILWCDITMRKIGIVFNISIIYL